MKPNIDFVGEVVSMREILADITNIDDIILMFNSVEQFSANIKVKFSVTNIEQIQMITKGQSDNNTTWFQFRKGTVTLSKSHEMEQKWKKNCQSRGWFCEHMELMPENMWLNQH